MQLSLTIIGVAISIVTVYFVFQYTKAAQEQVKVSQGQLKVFHEKVAASQKQLEALSMPCLTLIVTPLDVVGRLVGTGLSVRNIGKGPALKTVYRFCVPTPNLEDGCQLTLDGETPITQNGSGEWWTEEIELSVVATDQTVSLPSYVQGNMFVFRYESFSGKAYRSTATLNNEGCPRITGFEFHEGKESNKQPPPPIPTLPDPVLECAADAR